MFVSSLGTEVEPRSPNHWLKENIISKLDILNANEMKNLTSKTWRHAWANWAKDHTREDIRTMAFAMLSHSEQISDSNYHLIDKQKAVRFIGGVLADLGVNLEISFDFYFNLNYFNLI